jgi:hypothetical protein
LTQGTPPRADKEAAGNLETFVVFARLRDGFVGASFVERFSFGPLWTCKKRKQKACQLDGAENTKTNSYY